jgi:hypothetical protein
MNGKPTDCPSSPTSPANAASDAVADLVQPATMEASSGMTVGQRRQPSKLERLQDAILAGRLDDQAKKLRHLLAVKPGTDLSDRVRKCGTTNYHGGRFRCNRPPCPRCARRQSRRHYRKMVVPAFESVPRDRLRFATAIMELTTEITEIKASVARHDRALRHRLNKRIKSDPQWSSVRLLGWRELDVHRDTDLPHLGTNTQSVLSALGFPTTRFGEAVYVVHWHAIIDTGVIPPDDVIAWLREQWCAHPRQVDARRLWEGRSVIKSLRRLTDYGHKFRLCRDAGNGRREPLDREEVANLVEWYASVSRGFQWFRFSIGMRRLKRIPSGTDSKPATMPTPPAALS